MKLKYKIKKSKIKDSKVRKLCCMKQSVDLEDLDINNSQKEHLFFMLNSSKKETVIEAINGIRKLRGLKPIKDI